LSDDRAPKKPLPMKDVMAMIDDQVNASPSRSELSRWMRRNHDALAARFQGDRKIDWRGLAHVFEQAGLVDRTGKPASAETARKAWERARKAVAAARAKSGRLETPARSVPARPAVSQAPAPAPEPADYGEPGPYVPRPIKPKGQS
jgi:hypothetical protein